MDHSSIKLPRLPEKYVGVKIGYDEIKVRKFPRNVFFRKRKDNSQRNIKIEELNQVS